MTADEAVARARQLLDDPAADAQALRVERLDGGAPYWLVVLEGPRATTGVAALEDDGTVVGSGRPHGSARHAPVDEQRARQLLGAGPDTAVRLVWWPSRASRSPLFPLWQADVAGRARRLTLAGAVVEDAGPGGRGG
jgi:hypothetical protein